MGEKAPISEVRKAAPKTQGNDRLKATTHELVPARVTEAKTSSFGALVPYNKILIWAPALATEPAGMLLTWATTAAKLLKGMQIMIVLNGPGSQEVSRELQREAPPSVRLCALPGPASIGRAQQFVMHQFLRTDAQILARIDPDGQFPLSVLVELCRRLVPDGPQAVVAQRDAASVAGSIRFLGNVILRLAAMRMGLFADPNAGCYAMTRRAAAALCQVPLPKYPEPRMLAWLKEMSLPVSAAVVPTLPRHSGTSSIKGVGRALLVFLSSLLELLSCKRL